MASRWKKTLAGGGYILLRHADWARAYQLAMEAATDITMWAERATAYGCFTASPPFITKTGCSRRVTSFRGSPRTPTRSP